MASAEDFFQLYDADLKDKRTQIGKGAFSTVHRCVNRMTGEVCAVKVINTDRVKSSEITKIEREIAICKRLSHTNIVQMRNAFKDATHYYLVFEFVSGGELFDEIVKRTSYSEKDASECMTQILSGVLHCHRSNIIHRDLKPENLLLASHERDAPVKVTDFGLAVIMENGPSYFGFAGTPGYLSPEVCRRVPYDTKVDVWACGVILYILLAGYPPFWDEEQAKLYEQIKNADYEFPSPEWDSVTKEAKDLIKKMLQADPEKRMSIEEALRHPWINAPDSVASRVHRQGTIDELRRFNARRKIKGGFNAVLGVQRMMSLTPFAKAGARAAAAGGNGATATGGGGGGFMNLVKSLKAGADTPADDSRQATLTDEKVSGADKIKLEVLQANALALKAIRERDWSTYSQICSSSLSCFEPEAKGQLIEGMDFHKFYFDNVPAAAPGSFREEVLEPQVKVLSNDACITMCIRLCQYIKSDGSAATSRSEETRVWQRVKDSPYGWELAHFHRSGGSSAPS